MALRIIILLAIALLVLSPVLFEERLKVKPLTAEESEKLSRAREEVQRRRRRNQRRKWPSWKGPKTDERINQILAECMVLMKEIGCPISESICPEVRLTGTHCYYGRCCPKGSLKRYTEYDYYIEISGHTLHNTEKSLRNTLLHELIHTVPNGLCHTGEWKKWAKFVSEKTGYNIQHYDGDQTEQHIVNKNSQNSPIMNNETYKNASVVITGIANSIVLVLMLFSISKDSILNRDVYYEAVKWLSPVYTLTAPILFAWVGVLLRWTFPNPSRWIKWLLLTIIPATYLFWSFVPVHDWLFWGTGYRCTCLYAGILGYLINPKHLEMDTKWSLLLFLSAVFLYIGVSRVVDHFSVSSWQMLTNEWTRLFRRLMTFTPLAMSIIFLVAFSFSSVGQAIGRCRAFGTTSQILAGIGMISYLASVIDPTFPYYINLLDIYRLLVQPVIVYLIVVICRILRNGFKSPGIMQDIFKHTTHQ